MFEPISYHSLVTKNIDRDINLVTNYHNTTDCDSCVTVKNSSGCVWCIRSPNTSDKYQEMKK